MTCPQCGNRVTPTRVYDDDGWSYSFGICHTCGWDDEEEQRAAFMDAQRDLVTELEEAEVEEIELGEIYLEDYDEPDEDC